MLDTRLFPRKRVKYTAQSEVAECGLACIAMVAGFHGLKIGLGTLRRQFPPSTRGSSLKSIMLVADQIALISRAVKTPLEYLPSVQLPAILHWNMNHYVVIECFKSGRALVHDPATGSQWMSLTEISQHFTGVALELQPAVNFTTSSVSESLKLKNLWSEIRGFKRAALQTIILSVIIQLYVLCAPYYFQIAIDSAITDTNTAFLTIVAIGFGLLALMNGIAIILRAAVLLAAGSMFGFGLSTNVARKLFRLPVEWFSRRHAGDILSRFQSVTPIRKLLAEDAPATIIDGLLALLTLVLMLFYSIRMTLVALLAISSYGALRALLFSKQEQAKSDELVASGLEHSTLIESLRGIRSIRLAGREALRHAMWQSRMTDALNGTISTQRIANWYAGAKATLYALEGTVSIWISASFVMSGKFSVGMAFAFVAYKTQFMLAATSLVDKATDYKMLSLHLGRIADIALSEDDICFRSTQMAPAQRAEMIELKDVIYRYAPHDPLILDGVNLKIRTGESIAITGQSGGGKSTLLNLILGLAQPTGGMILINGQPMSSFGHRGFQAQVAAVLQDDAVFSGSLRENISMFDEHEDFENVVESAMAAGIHEDIQTMPLRYETLIGEMGSALSGGQRQRILLARALYRKPQILVIDEGTSHLDTERERHVNRSISNLGITRIIVAHRKETIMSADKIYILENGVISPIEKTAFEA